MLNIAIIEHAGHLAKKLHGARAALRTAKHSISFFGAPRDIAYASFGGAEFEIDRNLLIGLLEAEVARQEAVLRELGVDPV